MKRKAAIICPIKDEYTYIHKFLGYYRQHFSSEDIYVLDFGSTDEYLKNVIGDNARVVKTDANILDAKELFSAVRILQGNLYEKYEYVIALDVDEFLCYLGKGGLREYIQNLKVNIVTCQGHEVIHLPFVEESLDLNKPWMQQLKYWHTDHIHYGKTLLSRNELQWTHGFHTYIGETLENKIQRTDPNLFLVHMHKHDFNTTIARHIKWSKMKWSEDTIKSNHNYHYLEKSTQAIKEWYYRPIFDSKIYEIPQIIKENINI